MDELFAIEKEIGEIKAIVSLTKEDYEKVEDDRVPVKLQPVEKPPEKVEKDKDAKQDENAPPPEKVNEEGT